MSFPTKAYDYNVSGATVRVNLTKATFIGVPLETPVHYRPYHSILGQKTLDDLQQITRGGTAIGASTFTPIAGQVLAPTSQSQGVIQIPYGWGQRRYSVSLEFTIDHGGMTHVESLQGYTTHDGISSNGALDPAMGIYINSQTAGRLMKSMVNGVNRAHYGSAGSSQIITPINYTDPNPSSYNTSMGVANTGLRPTDVMNKAHLTSLNMEGVIDNTCRLTTGLSTTSTRDNALGNRYLSRVFQGYVQARGSNPGMEDMVGGIWGDASNAVNELQVDQLLLFSRLSQFTDINRANHVTIQELASMWPQIMDPQFTLVHMLSAGAVTDHTQFYDGWGSAVHETALAHVLCQSIPALMGGLLFSTYSFAMTNKTLTGQTELTTTGAAFLFDILDAPQRIASIEQHIKTEVAGYVLSNGVSDFSIAMQCVTMGSNTLRISVNGGPERSYSAPAYCDSLYTPVIGTSSDHLSRISSQLTYALETVYTSGADQQYTWG